MKVLVCFATFKNVLQRDKSIHINPKKDTDFVHGYTYSFDKEGRSLNQICLQTSRDEKLL